MMNLWVGTQLCGRLEFSKRCPTVYPGNMFIFLLAGHEVGSSPSSSNVAPKQSLQTTAHTLCFSFVLLALYPGEQERLYQHIKGVMSMSNTNGMLVGSWNLNPYRELTSM